MRARKLKIDFSKFLSFVLFAALLLLIISFTFLPKYTRIKELTEENEALSRQIEEVKQEIATLRKDLRSFKEGPFYLEKMAREHLGAAKENEVVVQIEE